MSALETQTPCCYCGLSIISSLLSFSFFLFHFPAKICARFSVLETGESELKLRHSLQNGLYSWSIILFRNLTYGHKITAFLNYAKHCSEAVCTLLFHAASAVTAVACLGPADTWEG